MDSSAMLLWVKATEGSACLLLRPPFTYMACSSELQRPWQSRTDCFCSAVGGECFCCLFGTYTWLHICRSLLKTFILLHKLCHKKCSLCRSWAGHDSIIATQNMLIIVIQILLGSLDTVKEWVWTRIYDLSLKGNIMYFKLIDRWIKSHMLLKCDFFL